MSDLTSSDVDAMTVLFALSIFCGQEMIPGGLLWLLTLIPFLALKQRDRAVERQDAGALVAILEI